MPEHDKVIIQVKNVGKRYQKGQLSSGSFSREVQSKWAKLRGKEDPNDQIVEDDERALPEERFWALRDVNFEVEKGEVLGIIGPNGSGKSTLLKILARITAPTTGEIRYTGRTASMLEVGTGFNPEMTGRENIYLNGAILGMSTEEINSKIEQIIDFSECRPFIDTPVKRYSSGMYVKLAFSVTVYLDSDIMILDEVLAVGDAAFQKKCIRHIYESATDENKTVLFVSHSVDSVRKLCSRCIVLNHGEKVFDGDVNDAIINYLSILKRVSAENAPKDSDRISMVDENPTPKDDEASASADVNDEPKDSESTILADASDALKTDDNNTPQKTIPRRISDFIHISGSNGQTFLRRTIREGDEEKPAKLRSLDVLDKLNLHFTSAEKLRLNISYKSFDVDDYLLFRVVVKNEELTPVAMACSERFCVKKGESGSRQLTISLSVLTEGSYICDLYIGQNENQTVQAMDSVPGAISFSLDNNPSQQNILWIGAAWGNCVLDAITDEGAPQ